MNWKEYPFIRILTPFILGIVTALYFKFNIFLNFQILCVIFCVLIIYVFFYRKIITYKYRWLTGVLFSIFFFFCGANITLKKNYNCKSDYISKTKDKTISCYGYVCEPIKEGPKAYKTILKIYGFYSQSKWEKSNSRIICYFQKTKKAGNLKYGDIILLNSHLSTISSPLNPYQFNYKKYLEDRFIYKQSYIKSDKWVKIDSGMGNFIIALAYKLRQKIIDIFDSNNITGREFAVVSALIVGCTDKIDADLYQDYSGSGVIHILSVSGLHVGLIYILFSFCLFFFEKIKYGKYFKAVLLILLVWFYAAITGISPPVLRASLMFSFIIIGKTFRNPPNIYNTIAASMMLILLVNPNYIMDVGFQLSYLAVIGIVAMYSWIYKLWIPKNFIIDKVWSLVAVSLAAQIITLPLTLYYFGKFPNYFILANLIAIPLSTLAIYTGISIIIFSFIPFISQILSKLLVIIVKVLNYLIHFIESAPGAITENIHINIFELFIMFFIIATIVYVINSKQYRILFFTCFTFILLLCSFTLKSFQNHNQKCLIIYSVKNHLAIDFIEGNKNIFIADSGLMKDKNIINFNIAANWSYSRLNNPEKYCYNNDLEINNQIVFLKSGFIKFNNITLAIVEDPRYSENKISVDYLIIYKKPSESIAELKNTYNFKEIIVTSNISNKKAKDFFEECKKLRINCYMVGETGAFIKKIM